MSLPVLLEYGFVSILLKPSPNGILPQNADVAKVINFGIVDAVATFYSGLVSEGQYVGFKQKEDQIVLIYGVSRYFIVQEKDILFIENEVIPP